jgi:hypothetical protein
MEKENGLDGIACPKSLLRDLHGNPLCTGVVKPIPGYPDGLKCIKCGTEVWTGKIPTWEEYKEMRRTSRTEELMGMSGPIERGGGSKSGRNKNKKKRKGMKFYYFDIKPKK